MSVDATVRAMLSQAGVQPPEPEIQEFIAGYPAVRESLRPIYAMVGLPETDGILIFRAAE
jgi:hypothetical protein